MTMVMIRNLFDTMRGLFTSPRALAIFAGLYALLLATIHLWIEAASDEVRGLLSGGASAVLKRVGNVFARAFSSDSVLTYALGLILFVAVPYAALFVNFSIKGTKTDFAVFVFRLLIAFVFTL